jgi:hypothetical protein
MSARPPIVAERFGGIAARVELRRLLGDEHEVVLVDSKPAFAMFWRLAGDGERDGIGGPALTVYGRDRCEPVAAGAELVAANPPPEGEAVGASLPIDGDSAVEWSKPDAEAMLAVPARQLDAATAEHAAG